MTRFVCQTSWTPVTATGGQYRPKDADRSPTTSKECSTICSAVRSVAYVVWHWKCQKSNKCHNYCNSCFPVTKPETTCAADSNWKVVNNPNLNDNKHKVLSNFGYAFDDSLDFMSKLNSGKYDKPFTEPILSNAGMSDTGFSSNTLHAQHINPDQEFLYSNPFTGRKGNKHKKLLVTNQTSFGLDLNQYPEDITDLFAPPLPTVDVVYGQPIRGSFPPRPVFDGRSIGKPRAESSKNSITVHYSQVEDDSPAVRPQNRRQVSALYYTPKNRTDNAFDNIEAYNLSETASQLNAVHYIDDLHNKTHIEFNKMSNIFNNYPTLNYTFDLQFVNRSAVDGTVIDGTYGTVADEQNITIKIDSSMNLTNDVNVFSDHYYRDNNKKFRSKANGNEKMVFSPKVLDENFTGLEWKPILGPVGALQSRPYSESVINKKFVESEQSDVGQPSHMVDKLTTDNRHIQSTGQCWAPNTDRHGRHQYSGRQPWVHVSGHVRHASPESLLWLCWTAASLASASLNGQQSSHGTRPDVRLRIVRRTDQTHRDQYNTETSGS